MTIQEKIDALKKEFEAKIDELEKQAKAEEQKQSRVWEPKEGDDCWWLTASGVSKSDWENDNIDNDVYLRGNIVKTKEEAEWQDKHRIVATELKHFVAENDPRPITEEDWENKQLGKYFIQYDYETNKIFIHTTWTNKTANQVYASNEEVLEKAIEHIGKERLKKYYFGVKE